MIIIGEGWEELAAALSQADTPERIYVIGSTNSGKTTLCRYLVDKTAAHMRAAYVDCDTGQSTVGPPTTEGMVLYPLPPGLPGRAHLRFVGSTSPGGHFLQTLTGAKRLVEKAAELGADATIIDSPGLVFGGVGIEFQVQMVDLLRPTRLVALQHGRELEPLLANFARHPAITIHRVPVSPAAVIRTTTERRRYREERFAAYFAEALPREVPLRGLGLQGRVPDLKNPHGARRRLVSLNDHDNFSLALGIAGEMHTRRRLLTVVAPPFDPAAVASIRFGSLNLDLDAELGSMESHAGKSERKRT
ncbi:polynucleotide 5'-hydroxyl-kinase [Methanoculleus sp. UBA413]|uniref:polynucleotide 5'-hydroxyl-kinase n=1 Tax=Methanoculleus sp. UBA413 TaxID=1915509 RepID=UPI00257C8FD6|nr:polynucleotide 5'-hydroxyl-kinase [Methanoculleus sp. UBA413]